MHSGTALLIFLFIFVQLEPFVSIVRSNLLIVKATVYFAGNDY